MRQQQRQLLLEAQQDSSARTGNAGPADQADEGEGVDVLSFQEVEEEPEDPGSPVSPNSVLFDNSSCSLMEAVALSRDELIERSRQISSDWLWDWTIHQQSSSGDTSFGMSEWQQQLLMRQQKKLSLRQWAIRRGLFSKDVLSFLLLSNLVSLLLGAGIGYSFLIKRSL